jgi:hypothetical protein
VGEEEPKETTRAAAEVEDRCAVPGPVGWQSGQDVRVHAATDLVEAPSARLRVDVPARAHPDPYDELVRRKWADHDREPTRRVPVFEQTPRGRDTSERRGTWLSHA